MESIFECYPSIKGRRLSKLYGAIYLSRQAVNYIGENNSSLDL